MPLFLVFVFDCRCGDQLSEDVLDLYQIFRVGSHVVVDGQAGIRFAITQGSLLHGNQFCGPVCKKTITPTPPSFFALALWNVFEDWNADGRDDTSDD